MKNKAVIGTICLVFSVAFLSGCNITNNFNLGPGTNVEKSEDSADKSKVDENSNIEAASKDKSEEVKEENKEEKKEDKAPEFKTGAYSYEYEEEYADGMEKFTNYLYFDKDGTVIESSDIKTLGIPQVIGMDFNYVVLNEPLPVSDPDIFREILDVSQLLEKYEIQVEKIYFDKNYNITLYFDQARVKLGNFDNIDEKIIRLKNILPELKGKKGVLRMENYTSTTSITTFERDDD